MSNRANSRNCYLTGSYTSLTSISVSNLNLPDISDEYYIRAHLKSKTHKMRTIFNHWPICISHMGREIKLNSFSHDEHRIKHAACLSIDMTSHDFSSES